MFCLWKLEKTPSKVGEFARTVKTLYIFFNVFYALSTNLRVFPISVQWIIMFHLVWKRDPYILDTTWDFGHSDIARSAKWRMKFQMEGTRHSPFNNDKWFADGKKWIAFASTYLHIGNKVSALFSKIVPYFCLLMRKLATVRTTKFPRPNFWAKIAINIEFRKYFKSLNLESLT